MARISRASSKSRLMRPYICCFKSFKQVICPLPWLFDHGCIRAAATTACSAVCRRRSMPEGCTLKPRSRYQNSVDAAQGRCRKLDSETGPRRASATPPRFSHCNGLRLTQAFPPCGHQPGESSLRWPLPMPQTGECEISIWLKRDILTLRLHDSFADDLLWNFLGNQLPDEGGVHARRGRR